MGNERLLRNELCGRNHGRLHELLAPNSINQGSGKGEHDQYRNHIKKFPGQQGTPLLQCSIIRWLAILFLCPLEDRTSVVSGKSGSVRVDLGGRRIIKKKKKKKAD